MTTFYVISGLAYGHGTYFARDAKYSCQTRYSPGDGNNNRYMYYCRVLTGEFTRGTVNIKKVPPPKDPSRPHIHYDSTVDKETNPSIFVTFYDTQAYPEYLITFQ